MSATRPQAKDELDQIVILDDSDDADENDVTEQDLEQQEKQRQEQKHADKVGDQIEIYKRYEFVDGIDEMMGDIDDVLQALAHPLNRVNRKRIITAFLSLALLYDLYHNFGDNGRGPSLDKAYYRMCWTMVWIISSISNSYNLGRFDGGGVFPLRIFTALPEKISQLITGCGSDDRPPYGLDASRQEKLKMINEKLRIDHKNLLQQYYLNKSYEEQVILMSKQDYYFLDLVRQLKLAKVKPYATQIQRSKFILCMGLFGKTKKPAIKPAIKKFAEDPLFDLNIVKLFLEFSFMQPKSSSKAVLSLSAPAMGKKSL